MVRNEKGVAFCPFFFFFFSFSFQERCFGFGHGLFSLLLAFLLSRNQSVDPTRVGSNPRDWNVFVSTPSEEKNDWNVFVSTPFGEKKFVNSVLPFLVNNVMSLGSIITFVIALLVECYSCFMKVSLLFEI